MKRRELVPANKNTEREYIINKAYQLFLLHGIDTVTLENVAKEADVPPIVIYRDFGDKKTLIIECGILFWEESNGLNDPTQTANYQYYTGYEQMEALISAFIPALLKFPQHLQFLQHFDTYMEQNHVSSEELKNYDAAIGEWNVCFAQAFEKGKQDHTIREGLDFKPVYYTMTHMLLAFAQKLACTGNLLGSDDIIPQEQQIKLAVDIMLTYIRSESSK